MVLVVVGVSRITGDESRVVGQSCVIFFLKGVVGESTVTSPRKGQR